MNDTERLDFLDRMMKGEKPNQRHFEFYGNRLFTMQTQHKIVASVRDAIDLMESYESGARCLNCENHRICSRHDQEKT